MATKQFAIPLDSNSTRPGDANFKELADAGASANFELTNATAGVTLNKLNLITKKNGATKDHEFALSFAGGSAKATLTASDLSAVYNDAAGGDWDYVEAKWTVGQIDTPNKSNMNIYQSGRTYNLFGW